MDCWKCWLVVALLVLSLGIAIGVLLKRNSDWKEIDRLWRDKIAELEKEVVRVDKLAQREREKADELREQRNQLRAALAESRKRVQDRPRPKTLADCVVQLADLGDHVALLEGTLELAESENLALRRALVLRSDQLEAQSLVIKTQRQRIEAMTKTVRRERIGKAFLSIGAGIVGGLAGFGVGKVAQ